MFRYKPFLPITWALEEVEAALNDAAVNHGGPSGPGLAALVGAFRTLAFEFRGHCGQITNWLKQPVPFPYFQFLTLLLIVDLVLIAYALTVMDLHWIVRGHSRASAGSLCRVLQRSYPLDSRRDCS